MNSFLILLCAAQAQGLDPLSPEVPAVLDAGEIASFDFSCGKTTIWPSAAMGLAPGDNVDAFAVGTDVFPPIGPAIAPPPPNTAVMAMFSVTRPSVGLNSAPLAEASTDGAASDVFAVEYVSGAGGAFLWSDARCLTRLPGQSDIDSLNLTKTTIYPVFFSLDPPTAARKGVDPADILLSPGDGTFSVVVPAALLGLRPGDDINGLAVGSGGLVFSLSAASPSAGRVGPVGSGGIYSAAGVPWAFAFHQSLRFTDDLNALTIGDPCWQHSGSFDPLRGVMCVNSGSGSTAETSVWRRYARSRITAGHATSGRLDSVRVGVNLIEDYDFDVEVRIWGSSSSSPSAARTLLAAKTVTVPEQSLMDSFFDVFFDGLDITDPWFWVEMRIHQSPGFPVDGRFYWAGTASENEPTFFSAPLCGITVPTDLNSMGFPDHALKLDVFGRPKLDMQHILCDTPAGGLGTLIAIGANPNEMVHFAYSPTGIGSGPAPPQLGGLQLDVLPPVTRIGSVRADAGGIATLQVPIPPALLGRTIASQAACARGANSIKSNADMGIVHP